MAEATDSKEQILKPLQGQIRMTYDVDVRRDRDGDGVREMRGVEKEEEGGGAV